MKIAMIYPYVVPKAEAYRPDWQRFIDTYKKFPAGIEHDLIIATCNGPTIEDQDLTYSDGVDFYESGPYHGEGCDIGCHQFHANALDPSYDWMVCCSSQVHFHRAGWLKRMVEARELFGPGMYGAMGSFEQMRAHIRTCFYAVEPVLFRGYPEVVNSRVKSLQFESQPNNFLGWLQGQGLNGYMVAWDCICRPEDFRKPANVFRRGDQSNCLVWDRHTAIYASDTPEQRAITEALADGK